MIIQIEHLGFQPLRILCCDAEIVAATMGKKQPIMDLTNQMTEIVAATI